VTDNENRCPFCEYKTPEPLDGDAFQRGWQEVAHMTLDHPNIISARMRENVLDDSASRFGPES
jgi:lipoate synthase